MNSTDKQNLVIRKMFAEPIGEVDKAFIDVVYAADLNDNLMAGRLTKLRESINNLKAILPVIQDAP